METHVRDIKVHTFKSLKSNSSHNPECYDNIYIETNIFKYFKFILKVSKSLYKILNSTIILPVFRQ